MEERNWISILISQGTQKEVQQRANEILATLSTAPSSTGREQLKTYLSGKIIGKADALRAKCFDCSGHYVDGRKDCEVEWCPLYPYMPYGKLRKKRYVRPDRLNNWDAKNWKRCVDNWCMYWGNDKPTESEENDGE